MRARTSRIFAALGAPPGITCRTGRVGAGGAAEVGREADEERRRSAATRFLPVVRGRRALGTVRLPLLRAAVLFLDPGIDFLAVDLHLGRCFDAELHLA